MLFVLPESFLEETILILPLWSCRDYQYKCSHFILLLESHDLDCMRYIWYCTSLDIMIVPEDTHDPKRANRKIFLLSVPAYQEKNLFKLRGIILDDVSFGPLEDILMITWFSMNAE